MIRATPVTFAIMFIAAFFDRHSCGKAEESSKQSAQSAFRTKVLFLIPTSFAKANSDDEIITVTANQLIKRWIGMWYSTPRMTARLEKRIFFSVAAVSDDLISENEKAVAAWVLKNNKHAGATTATLGSAKCLYLSIRLGDTVYGVVGIHINGIRWILLKTALFCLSSANVRWL